MNMNYLFRSSKLYLMVICVIGVMLITGCGTVGRNIAPPQDTVPIVQEAVDRYVLTHQEPPVKKPSINAGRYERYPIHFRALINTMQLSEAPSNAYENGGPYYYVLIQDDAEKWHVKLIDMIVWQQVNDIQLQANQYLERNGRLPASEKVSEGIFRLDAKALGLEEGNVRSVYSPQMLPLLITSEGEIVIDYSFEIMRAIQSLGESFQPRSDLRDVLIEQSFMLPVHSLPYEWVDDQPLIVNVAKR